MNLLVQEFYRQKSSVMFFGSQCMLAMIW